MPVCARCAGIPGGTAGRGGRIGECSRHCGGSHERRALPGSQSMPPVWFEKIGGSAASGSKAVVHGRARLTLWRSLPPPTRFTHGKRSGVYGALRRFLSNGGSRSPLRAIVESENLEYKELTA